MNALKITIKINLITPNVQQHVLRQDALFPGRHKPIPGGLTAAVLAADTREKGTLSLHNWSG